MHINWEGIMPAVTTKFTSSDSLDLEMMSKNLLAQQQAGVSAIILAGTLGEASTLTSNEKLILLQHTVSLLGSKTPVIINIAEQSTKEAINYAKRAEDHGASGFMLLPPMRYKSDNHETVTFFKKIANSTTLPIMLYNNPIDYGIEITIDMFSELAAIDNIKAVKESTRNISNVTKMQLAFGDRFKILSGVDTLALESLLMGANGWVAGLVCAFPNETVAIYKLVKENRIEEAKNLYKWFLPLLELDVSTKLVQNIKLAESIVGLGTEFVREPRLPLSGNEREKVLKIIKESIEKRPKLPTL